MMLASLVLASATAWSEEPPSGSAAIREIQRELVEHGFAAGYPDGEWGANTRAAWAEFERTLDLEPDGEPDPASLRALFAPPDDGISKSEIQRVRGLEPPSKVRGFTRTFALGAGSGFLLASILAAMALWRQRAVAS